MKTIIDTQKLKFLISRAVIFISNLVPNGQSRGVRVSFYSLVLCMSVFTLTMFAQQSVALTCQQQEDGLGTSLLSGYNDLVNMLSGKEDQMMAAAAMVKQAEYVLEVAIKKSKNPSPGLSVADRAVEEYKAGEAIKRAQKEVTMAQNFLHRATKELGFSYKDKVVIPFISLMTYNDYLSRKVIMELIEKGLSPSILPVAVELAFSMILAGKVKLPPVVDYLIDKASDKTDKRKKSESQK